MWIYIQREKSEDPWVGTVAIEDNPKSRWKFELVRHSTITDLYSSSPLEGSKPVPALLDHQRRCTIIRPLVTKVDPGRVGIEYHALRTRIEGTFEALLTGLFVQDETSANFTTIAFDSESFSLWQGRQAFKSGFNADTSSQELEVVEPERDVFQLGGVGQVTSVSDAAISVAGGSGAIRSRAIFRLTLDDKQPLQRVMELCHGLELLFGFLAGFRPKPPAFSLVADEVDKVGERDLPRTGTLEFGGFDWKVQKPPHPMECVHRCGDGGLGLKEVLEKFLANADDLVTRIHTVEFSRFFSRNLNDKFAVVMPVLEAYLTGIYAHRDEKSYLGARQRFFDWVDSAADPDIAEYAKKHLKEKGSKAPSLTTLLRRAIESLNADGFLFTSDLAARINKRRGRVFHGATMLDEDEARAFYDEVRAITGILMLHTYRDLGVDISNLCDNHWAFPDLRGFLARPGSQGLKAESGQIGE